uniref:Uncharacterized protein n=1 Tax=Nyssomyia neivai TaxID=330878 RepID=A0A1L8D823_9DIPT
MMILIMKIPIMYLRITLWNTHWVMGIQMMRKMMIMRIMMRMMMRMCQILGNYLGILSITALMVKKRNPASQNIPFQVVSCEGMSN